MKNSAAVEDNIPGKIDTENYQGFDIGLIESYTYEKSIEKKIEALKIIEKFARDGMNHKWRYGRISCLNIYDTKIANENPDYFFDKIVTRIAHSIANLIMSIEGTDEQSMQEQLETVLLVILNKKGFLSALFCGSLYGNTDNFIIALINKFKQNSFRSVNEKSIFLLKLAILYNLNSQVRIEIIFDYFVDHRNLIGGFLLGLISDNFVCTSNASENRNWLLEHVPKVLDNLKITFVHEAEKLLFLNPLCSAYMFCTYSSKEKRHSIKESIHNLIRNSNMSNRLLEYEKNLANSQKKIKGFSTNYKTENGKPYIFIIIERFGHGHAMYRCFSKLVEGLRERFTTVCISFAINSLDEIAKKSFDYHHLINGKDLNERTKKLVSILEKYQPHAIYYPSVGMDPFVIVTASFRLAQKQIYSLGHPAPAMSKVLDGIITSHTDTVIDHDIFAENIPVNNNPMLVLKKEIEPQESWKLEDWNRKLEKEKVQIAITATSFKLSYQFFSLIKKLEETHSGQYHLNFFVGSGREVVDGQIKRFLNTEFSKISSSHGFLQYSEYLNNLNKCDLCLSPFPFGNTNSLVDCIRCGIVGPCLATNQQYVEFAEKRFYEMLGLHEFVASTPEEYLDITRELIDAGLNKKSEKIERLSSNLTPKECLLLLETDIKGKVPIKDIINNYLEV